MEKDKCRGGAVFGGVGDAEKYYEKITFFEPLPPPYPISALKTG